MANSELMKLGGILLIGLLILVIGFIIQRKSLSKKKEDEEMMSKAYSSDSEISEEESRAKTYIEEYKTTYPIESLKQGLLQTGIDISKVEEYLNKYFN